MNTPIQEFSLSDAGVQVLDCEHKTPLPVTHGFPYIAIPDIQGGRVVWETTRTISESDLELWTRRYSPQEGDILVTRRGRVGDTAPIPSGVRCAIGQNLVLLRSTGVKLDPRYLRWATRSPQWWLEVERLKNVGAVFSSLNVRDIGKIRVPVPSLPYQCAIAEVLGALDDKIAANTKLVAMAEMLSQTLFSSMLDEDSQLIPLSASAQFINGKAFTKNATGTGRVVIRIAELNSGLGGSTVYNDIDVPEQHLAQPGSILFAWSGSLTLHRWFRPEGIVNQHIFKVIPTAGYPEWLIFELLRKKLDEFKSIAADKATTMGHIQRKHLDEHIQVPSDSTVIRHNLLMQSLWSQGLNAEMENESLAATRDALLPQLMSGTLRVKDAEVLVSEAV